MLDLPSILEVTKDHTPAELRWKRTDTITSEALRAGHETEAIILLRIMNAAKGVGLASCQIGHSYKMFVTQHIAALNPTILSAQYYKDVQEGCLSIPGKTGIVGRARKIKLKYFDVRSYEWVEITVIGSEAHVIQHEVDHLNGVLFTDYEGVVTGR